MKLTFRTVTNKVFKLDLDASTKVKHKSRFFERAFSALHVLLPTAHALEVDADLSEAVPLKTFQYVQIGEVKARIQSDQGETYPAGSTVLIYQGKVNILSSLLSEGLAGKALAQKKHVYS